MPFDPVDPDNEENIDPNLSVTPKNERTPEFDNNTSIIQRWLPSSAPPSSLTTKAFQPCSATCSISLQGAELLNWDPSAQVWRGGRCPLPHLCSRIMEPILHPAHWNGLDNGLGVTPEHDPLGWVISSGTSSISLSVCSTQLRGESSDHLDTHGQSLSLRPWWAPCDHPLRVEVTFGEPHHPLPVWWATPTLALPQYMMHVESSAKSKVIGNDLFELNYYRHAIAINAIIERRKT